VSLFGFGIRIMVALKNELENIPPLHFFFLVWLFFLIEKDWYEMFGRIYQ
jgi:hypothetical protein